MPLKTTPRSSSLLAVRTDAQTTPKVAKWVQHGRALHLIDVENLVGCSRPGAKAVNQALESYRQEAAVREGDHVMIGCHPGLGLAVHAAWPGAQIRVGHGPDGADHALLDWADPDDLARRFFRVCVGSGDGFFAELLRELRERGVEVRVVSRRRSTSRRIRKVAAPTYVPTPALALSKAG